MMRALGTRRLWPLVLALLSAILLAGCEDGIGTSGKPATVYQADSMQLVKSRSASAVPKTYVVQPGDAISVFVLDNPDLSKTVVVGPDGKFRYPLVGEVNAAGRSLRSLESILAAGLSRTIVAAQVSASLADLKSYRIYVDGEVVNPGEYRTDGPVTVVQAIAMAGGFTAFASRDDLIIYNPLRDGGQRITFNYDLFVKSKNQPDLFLLPGDTVIVD